MSSSAKWTAQTAHFQWLPSSSGTVLKSWAQKTVIFKSRNLSFRHNTTVFWGACKLSSCNTCSARKGGLNGTEMGKKKQKTALVGACKRWHSRYTDTGWRWHHYLECLHLLAWGCHHWCLCLQLHSRDCALCLQVRQDIWASVIREKKDLGFWWFLDTRLSL